jgi:hypothetical protein
MTYRYPTRKWWLPLLCLFILGFNNLFAQSANAFEQALTMAKVEKSTLNKPAPHLYKVVTTANYTIEDINKWIKEYPKEWEAFTHIESIEKLNLAWPTLGIKTPVAAYQFTHSMYNWYKAAKISEEKRKALFPHFPLPDLKNDPYKEEQAYETRVATWQRLYPEEYETFLNTPELTALNPYYNGYYKLSYIPRFIGQDVTEEKPKRDGSVVTLMDEYKFQLRLRNWYFIFQPEEFNRLYGKDYKFPDSFDAKAYRDQVLNRLKLTKEGKYPNMDNSH